jgi:hypothetical protein
MRNVLLSLLVPLVLGCATTPPPPAGVAPRANLTARDYYPLTGGWKWAYDLEREGTTMLATYAVLESSGDVAVVQTGDDKLLYAVTPDGIAQKEGAVIGDYVIKNPVAVGTEWPVEGGRAKIVSVTEEFKLEPFGRLLGCVRVEATRSNPTRVTSTTFAPDIGPVALEVSIQDGQKFVTTTRAKLRAVTKPGQDVFGNGN